MGVYKVLCTIKFVVVAINSTLFVMRVRASRMEDTNSESHTNHNFDEMSSDSRFVRIYGASGKNQSQDINPAFEDSKIPKTFEMVFVIIYAVLEIYIYACIKSLYSDIEEESNPKGSQVSINPQQPLTTSHVHHPHYNATPHPVQPAYYYPQPSCSNVTVIPLQATNR